MAIEIKTWQITNDGKLTPINSSLYENNRKEREDLEYWIKNNPEILGDDIILIGEQIQTVSGQLDFLGIDKNGNLIVVELKRASLPREALAQAIDYASDVANWGKDKLSEMCQAFVNLSLEEFIAQKFPDTDIEELVINQEQRILLVGFSIEEPLNRMIEWLASKYDMGINAIVLSYAKTSKGEEILSRTVVISEEFERLKTNKRKLGTADQTWRYILDNSLLKQGETIFFKSTDIHIGAKSQDYLTATITGKYEQRNFVCWNYDKQEYSITGLTRKILKDNNIKPGALNGNQFWYTKEDVNLYELAKNHRLKK